MRRSLRRPHPRPLPQKLGEGGSAVGSLCLPTPSFWGRGRGWGRRAQPAASFERREPLMKIKNLGRTGLKVSELCLGCMTFGKEADDESSIRMIHRALDAGLNFLDTANVYSRG